ncbi:MAG TPA: hypothetical protein EYP10_11325, partial [Armatimonadetes bacterium]|nr:hypothetical protein [Armatimonadota bacterium]
MKGVAIYLACALLIVSGAHGGIFREDFSTHRPRWHLESGGVGKVSIADGRLVLDLSTAKRGKWAFAELHIAITLPARIEWEQCLAHDSRYTWFCGVHLWSARRRVHEWLIAGLGGGGLKNCFFLAGERSPEGMVKVGQWYRFVLDVHKERQTLTVFARGSVAPLIQLQSHRALPHSPFFLRFFQNSHRLRKCSPDGYDQDRGTTWIDNVVLTAQKLEVRKPPKPIVTNPYKVPIVFNRAMRWLTKEDGLLRACIAYEAVGWLALTGKRCVSHWVQLRAWHEQDLMQLRYEPNIKHDDELRTTFTLPAKVNEATFAIRALQFNTEQHPILQWEGILNGRLEWQIEVTATDGIHPFMWRIWASEWFDDKANGKVNIARAYHRSGRPNRYAEVDVLLHLRRRAPGDANLRLRLGMPGRVAIVPRTPIVSTIAQAKRSGIAISAIVVDERGRIVTDPAVEL